MAIKVTKPTKKQLSKNAEKMNAAQEKFKELFKERKNLKDDSANQADNN